MAGQAVRTAIGGKWPDDDNGIKCSNLGLYYDKLTRDIPEKNNKAALLKKYTGVLASVSDNVCYRYAYKNWMNIQRKLESEGKVRCIEITSMSRVLLGTGNSSVLENGIQLNTPWGVPYISGTTLKGLVSSYMSKYGGDAWKRNKNGQKSEAQVELFGGEKDGISFSGSIGFTDAWLVPDGTEWFDQDIITVHYPKYYSGKGWPTGMEDPVPVPILALKPGLHFSLSLYGNSVVLEQILEVMRDALKGEGIGGKTAVGYGRFAIEKNSEEKKNESIASIEKSTTNSDFKDQYAKYKDNLDPDIKNALIKALLRIGYCKELETYWDNLLPSQSLEKFINSDPEKASLQKVNKKYREILEKCSMDEIISEDRYAVFNLLIKTFGAKEISESKLKIVSDLKYTWEDMALSDEFLEEYVLSPSEERSVWPPVSELITLLKSRNIRGCTDEVIKLVLSELHDV
ncbi:type III-B CRISPR module RAMP protein Cmr6 [Spirochaeta dissipatitropha]